MGKEGGNAEVDVFAAGVENAGVIVVG